MSFVPLSIAITNINKCIHEHNGTMVVPFPILTKTKNSNRQDLGKFTRVAIFYKIIFKINYVTKFLTLLVMYIYFESNYP